MPSSTRQRRDIPERCGTRIGVLGLSRHSEARYLRVEISSSMAFEAREHAEPAAYRASRRAGIIESSLFASASRRVCIYFGRAHGNIGHVIHANTVDEGFVLRLF